MGETTRFLREHPEHNTEFLVAKAKENSQDAWRILLERYHTMLIAHVRVRIPGFARRSFDAEDALQIACMKAHEAIGDFTYRGEGAFRRWLATLAVNAFRSELRKRSHEHAQIAGGDEALEDLPESETRAGVDAQLAAVLEAMGGMSEEDRDILIQRDFERMTFEEIARTEGWPRERARTLYLEAFKRLQGRLGA